MLSKFELSELEIISKLSPQECKERLIQFLEESRLVLKRAEELRNWGIRFVFNKQKRPWIYVQMYNEVFHGVTRQLEMKDCVTLGKIHSDDYENQKIASC